MTYPKPSPMKNTNPPPKVAPSRQPKSKINQAAAKKFNYDVELVSGEVVVMRGTGELEVVELAFKKYATFPISVKKTAFTPKAHLTDRPFNNSALLELKKNLEKGGK